MKKHTMQEWADFLGVYVAKDLNGTIFAYNTKTEIRNNRYEWYRIMPNLHIPCEIVSDAENHDWHVLVEPHKDASDE